MKAISFVCTETPFHGFGSLKQQSKVRSPLQAEEPLISDIRRLGGEARVKGAEGALKLFEATLHQLVGENPKRFGAGNDPASQARVVAELLESVKIPFLARSAADLRQKAGYIQTFGYWIHRAVFTFVGFGLLAAFVLPLCAVSLMSTRAWGWLPGALGLVASVAAGAWILTRIRSK